MIPKIIHYCWFGGKPLPALAQRCIASWEKYCPEYTVMRWDESTFDVTENRYAREAFAAKKYAFVTDYVRLYVLCKYGGVYLDTDVELVSGLEPFLGHGAFSGFEDTKFVPTGLMAGERGFPLYQELLEYYTGRGFVRPDGSLDVTPNTESITELLQKKGLRLNGRRQEVEGLVLYPKEVFCPLNQETGRVEKTENTVAIHWFAGSWERPVNRFRGRVYRFINRNLGPKAAAAAKAVFGRKNR